jgi:hypothetical protein
MSKAFRTKSVTPSAGIDARTTSHSPTVANNEGSHFRSLGSTTRTLTVRVGALKALMQPSRYAKVVL